jgi:hypothetical protein
LKAVAYREALFAGARRFAVRLAVAFLAAFRFTVRFTVLFLAGGLCLFFATFLAVGFFIRRLTVIS